MTPNGKSWPAFFTNATLGLSIQRGTIRKGSGWPERSPHRGARKVMALPQSLEPISNAVQLSIDAEFIRARRHLGNSLDGAGTSGDRRSSGAQSSANCVHPICDASARTGQAGTLAAVFHKMG